MFNNYNHFKNYCLKVASNAEYELDEKEKNDIIEFEYVFNFIEELKNKKVVAYKVCILDAIANYFKHSKCYDGFKQMDYFIRKINNAKSSEVYDIYYILTSLNTILGIGIEIVEDFVLNRLGEDNLYLCRIKVIEILRNTEFIRLSYDIDNNYIDKFGIYFIYDAYGELAYIGKSTSCILTRAIKSVEERNLFNFSKIELRECKSKSDVGIYEAYYISKYKPRCNSEFVFDDDVTFELPKLPISKEINRDVDKDYIEYSYIYMNVRVVDIEDFLMMKNNKNVCVFTSENIKNLNSMGIYDKYKMSELAYKEVLSKNKDKINNIIE